MDKPELLVIVQRITRLLDQLCSSCVHSFVPRLCGIRYAIQAEYYMLKPITT